MLGLRNVPGLSQASETVPKFWDCQRRNNPHGLGTQGHWDSPKKKKLNENRQIKQNLVHMETLSWTDIDNSNNDVQEDLHLTFAQVKVKTNKENIKFLLKEGVHTPAVLSFIGVLILYIDTRYEVKTPRRSQGSPVHWKGTIKFG